MENPSLLIAASVVLFWIFGISLSTYKYLKALRAGKRLDKWIWFFCWCFVIAFVEWFAFFGYVIVSRIIGIRVEL
ncbi:hypothetical protein A3A67_03405 [Candidatus Peribacteria bacterium RIFCSPLOWO2_01_FULL_51_18]|nr:MAG: hypothetical protein A3C52_04655 [Candidatus Peribacteria bacterium RIFCSPHIGHO2_02_FULL_51_15]OGJ65776.1 MAG: hypothetical protein A3A67_03405 [Candidatus Peribacteria bacterium RIFCSPLOWO2_01_FULL_51_18]OGJ68564.1 MAG: hypothetical protein A3J34_03755 [Candidatus Peribacteria bacterium RIFCSPLOWO2_02_FULL_51_10]